MIRVMAIDPGLARCGLVIAETDGTAHRFLRGECFESDGDVASPSLLADPRVDRARLLRGWIAAHLRTWTPNVVAMESFGFLQGQHATSCLAMAYMTLVDSIDRAQVPLIGCAPRHWRDVLAPLHGERVSTSTKGMTKTKAKATRRQDQKTNALRTKDREKRAHTEAQRRVEGSIAIQVRFSKTQEVHVLDSLGLFCWSVQHPVVLSMARGG
jgi:Holliday junction resolvasome RuvABC endonuclease subunit